MMLSSATAAQIGGRLYDRLGVKAPASAGMALATLGLCLQALGMQWQSYSAMLPGLVCFGLGTGMTITPTNTDALSRAKRAMRGQASGAILTIRQAGSTLGMAGMASVSGLLAHRNVEALARGVEGQGEKALLALLVRGVDGQPQALAELQSRWPEIAAQARDGLADALSGGIWFAAGMSLVGFATARLFMQRGGAGSGRVEPTD